MPTDDRVVCAMCGTSRSFSDMACELRGDRKRYFCHPFAASATTCYQQFVMGGFAKDDGWVDLNDGAV